jgi:hypothetical protein
MQRAAPHEQNANVQDESRIAAHFTVQPYDMERVCVGRYKERNPKPKFRIYYDPKQDEPHVVTHSDSKISNGTIYDLYYRFQNFGDKPCVITILRIGEDLGCVRAR